MVTQLRVSYPMQLQNNNYCDQKYLIHFYIIYTVVLLNFTRPFYAVTESEGLDEVCVRLELPRGGVIRRPVTFRIHIVATGSRCMSIKYLSQCEILQTVLVEGE